MTSLEPSRYSTLALTHVQYDSTSPLAKFLSLITLAPIFLLCSYLTIILYRRELTFINAFIGQVACEGLNWGLKRVFKQSRPTDFLGSGYGMPSSHSQFLGFFASYFLLHFYIHRPTFSSSARNWSLIGGLRRLEWFIGMIGIATLSLGVCYSRWHLSYHTPSQILIGLSIGLGFGGSYYWVVEGLSKRPMNLKKSGKGNEKQRASSIREMVLDHPIAVAFRIRDSWLVWRDGGVEGEYGIWREEWQWERNHKNNSLHGSRITKRNSNQRLEMMKVALREADKSIGLKTAFCVGCVITISSTSKIISTGFSRELEGNTHAEQVAISKILELITDVGGKAVKQIGKDRTLEIEIEIDLYTTMEPCSERLSGQSPCSYRILEFNKMIFKVERNRAEELFGSQNGIGSGEKPVFLRFKVSKVLQGVKEPEDFVDCKGQSLLRENGIGVEQVIPFEAQDEDGERKGRENWLELECLRIAKKGHDDEPKEKDGNQSKWK